MTHPLDRPRGPRPRHALRRPGPGMGRAVVPRARPGHAVPVPCLARRARAVGRAAPGRGWSGRHLLLRRGRADGGGPAGLDPGRLARGLRPRLGVGRRPPSGPASPTTRSSSSACPSRRPRAGASSSPPGRTGPRWPRVAVAALRELCESEGIRLPPRAPPARRGRPGARGGRPRPAARLPVPLGEPRVRAPSTTSWPASRRSAQRHPAGARRPRRPGHRHPHRPRRRAGRAPRRLGRGRRKAPPPTRSTGWNGGCGSSTGPSTSGCCARCPGRSRSWRRGGRGSSWAWPSTSPRPERLFGRYWGGVEEHPFLHFNVALYHSVEECIRLGRQRLRGGRRGGAQARPRLRAGRGLERPPLPRPRASTCPSGATWRRARGRPCRARALARRVGRAQGRPPPPGEAELPGPGRAAGPVGELPRLGEERRAPVRPEGRAHEREGPRAPRRADPEAAAARRGSALGGRGPVPRSREELVEPPLRTRARPRVRPGEEPGDAVGEGRAAERASTTATAPPGASRRAASWPAPPARPSAVRRRGGRGAPRLREPGRLGGGVDADQGSAGGLLPEHLEHGRGGLDGRGPDAASGEREGEEPGARSQVHHRPPAPASAPGGRRERRRVARARAIVSRQPIEHPAIPSSTPAPRRPIARPYHPGRRRPMTLLHSAPCPHRSSASAGSPSATATSPRSTASTSTWPRGRSWRCSARTAPGKTTLISIVAGLVRASAGEATVLGRDVVRDYRVHPARRRAGPAGGQLRPLLHGRGDPALPGRLLRRAARPPSGSRRSSRPSTWPGSATPTPARSPGA